jgi:copper chaperone
MTNIKLQTEGMHCTSCEMLIKYALEDLDGISKVEASYKSGMIEIDFDDSKTKKEQIIEVIKNEGFKIRK